MFVKMHRVMCLLVTALLILLQITCQNNLEKQFLCKNEECSEPMGEFRVAKKYIPDSAGKIGANARDSGVILARPEDKSTGLLKVKIGDRIGFFPTHFITVLKEEKGNIAVKLTIPVSSVVNSGSSDIPSTPDLHSEKERNTELNDASASDDQTDGINSTVGLPSAESSYNESTSSAVEDSSNKNEKPIPTLKPALDEPSTLDQFTSEPLNNDQTKKDPSNSDDESSYNQRNIVEGAQNETVGQEKEQVVPDVPLKLENTSAEANESKSVNVVSEKLENTSVEVNESKVEDVVSLKLDNISVEINESKIVDVIEESENITESIINISRDTIENVTPTIRQENVNNNNPVESIADTSSKVENNDHVNEISNSSELASGTIESLNDSTATHTNLKNIQNESPSNLPKIENSTNSNDNLKQSSDAVKEDHVESSPDKVEAEAKIDPEADLSSLNVDSQNNSTTTDFQNNFATTDLSNNTEAVIEQKLDSLETDHTASVSKEVQTDNETSAESQSQVPFALPTMQSFPDKEPLVSKESKISLDEIINVTESGNQNTTSEEIDSVVNATLDLEPNSTESDHVTEGNLQYDTASPKSAPYEIPPPHYIETTTETNANTKPIDSVKNFESNESVLTESPIASSTPVSEDTPPSKLSQPYQYIKPQPYPSLFPNIATENQPAVSEKIDQGSSQEVIEEDPKSIEQMSELGSSDPVTVPVSMGQKQGLNDFIHSSRKEISESIPAESVNEPEALEEKSVYETIQEYFPDFGILVWSFFEKSKSFFDFGSSSQTESIESESCSAEQFCGTDRLNSQMDKPEHPESEIIYEIPLFGVVNKDQITLVSGILTTAFLATILLWWLMNYFNRSKKVGLLVSRINQLENKLLISTREVASLQEKLAEQDSVAISKQNAADVKRITDVYEHKINQYKKRTVELEDKVLYLEKELENVSNSALEMHKLLENSLVTQAQSKLALDEVETLRALAESQEIQIDELKREINSVITENECLKVDNDVNKSTIKKLEKECNAQTKKNVELSEKNRNLTLKLDKEVENNNALESNYKSEIYELRSKLEDVEMSWKRSEFQVRELQRAVLDKQDGVQISSNDVQLKIQISTLEAMNNELSGLLNEQKNARRMLEDHVGDITKELNNLKKSFENSEKERNQAVTKLQVLTQFFKEKEEQLKKELEAKDKLSLERESKDQSLSQKLTLMREEISNLKIQNEELKKEVLDQEASYKVQLANAEQKTREHWFALRQAERKYKESQQEAAILRNKILVLETNMSSISHKVDDKNSSGINGDIPGVSPVLYHPSLSPDLLPYPSPSDFIPPPPSPIPSHSPDFFPPEPIYSPDERLPPLGGRRAPSPPPPISPDDDFGPPPPVMKYTPGRNHNVEPPIPGGYNRRTPPPSGRHRSQFKSRPPRSSIDSPSSGMSLESLDKSGR